MTKQTLSSKQMIAFKIGARARKFAVEGCPIEGYDYLYGCLAEAKETDAELYMLLTAESEKFDKRMAEMTEADMKEADMKEADVKEADVKEADMA